MSAHVIKLPRRTGADQPTTLRLGELRILRTGDCWHVARPQASGGLIGICSASSLAGALAAARAVQGAA